MQDHMRVNECAKHQVIVYCKQREGRKHKQLLNQKLIIKKYFKIYQLKSATGKNYVN